MCAPQQSFCNKLVGKSILLSYNYLQVSFQFRVIYLKLNSLGIGFGNCARLCVEFVSCKKFSFAVTMTAYGVVGSVSIDMVYYY